MLTVENLKNEILAEGTDITGALLDSYVAGYWADATENPDNAILKNENLRVGTVIDHQFAYGFVVDGVLQDVDFTKCLRQKLNRMETEITTIIQTKARTMEVSIFHFFCHCRSFECLVVDYYMLIYNGCATYQLLAHGTCFITIRQATFQLYFV